MFDEKWEMFCDGSVGPDYLHSIPWVTNSQALQKKVHMDESQ